MNPNKPDCLKVLPGARARTCTVVLLAALAACGQKTDDQTVGQKLDTAVAKTGQAAAEAKAKAEVSIGKAATAIKSAGEKVEGASKSNTDKAGSTLDDASITTAVSAAFLRDKELSAIKINVDTKNGSVTLNGYAPNLAAKDKAATLAKAVKGVTSVDNKLVIKGS